MKTLIPLFVLSIVAFGSSNGFSGGLIVSETKLEALATDGSAFDRFGIHQAISGDTIVVGAYYVDGVNRRNRNDSSGAAYVFFRSGTGWVQQAKLTASDAGSGDEFGYYVGISGDTIVVSSGNDDNERGTDVGAAYVYVRNGTTWTEQAKLVPSDGVPFSYFSRPLAISGDTIVAAGGNTSVDRAVYVFTRTGDIWTEIQKLQAADQIPGDQFGASLSIDGDSIVAGAIQGGFGSAYVFTRTGGIWSQQAKLTASDGSYDFFGSVVSISGDTVVVGAPRDDTGSGHDADGVGTGSAYVFVRNAGVWSQQDKLIASDGAFHDDFGTVAISGDRIVVGASRQNPGTGAGAGATYVFVRAGTSWTEERKLTASDGAAGDGFGGTVAIDGDTIVTASIFDDTIAKGLVEGGVDAGSAYVFTRSGTSWTQQQKLEAKEIVRWAHPNDQFGEPVAIGGETAVVAAPNNDGYGGVFVFVRSGGAWIPQARLTQFIAGNSIGFGRSVAISGNTIVVGAPTDYTTGFGSVFVFVRTGNVWSQEQRIIPTDGKPGDAFGFCVALEGDMMVIGSGSGFGSAYVYTRSGNVWTQQAKLAPSDGVAGIDFGASAAISGDTIIVGAIGPNGSPGARAGAVYVFVKNGATWTEQAKLVAADWKAGERFGNNVALDGDSAIIGALFGDTPLGADAGSAYVFVRNGTTWTQQQKLTASDGTPSAFFSAFFGGVAIKGDRAVVGAPGQDTALGIDTGAAYLFVRNGTTWTEQQRFNASDTAAGDNFGVAVAMSGDYILVGAKFADTPAGVDAGSAYILELLSNTAPTIHCPASAALEATSPDGAAATLTVAVEDSDGDALEVKWTIDGTLYQTDSVPSGGTSTAANVSFTALFGLGGHEISVSVSDGTADPVSCQASLSVVDTTPPTILCPANLSLACSPELLVPVSFAATATDLADPAPIVTYSQAPGSGFAVGTTVINAKATDASGNQSTCSFTVTRAALDFEGFLSPLGGADASGGSFADPLRTFKLGSTIPLKFKGACGGSALLTGVHTLQTVKWSSATSSEEAIDATPSDAATTGHQFRLTPEQWQFNLDTKATGMTAGVWEIVATLSDGSQHRAWIQIK